jgi:hypothetical protein
MTATLSVGGDHRTQYATGAHEAQIAFQIVGSGPLDLVYLTGRVSNVDVRWDDPASARFLDDLPDP